MADRLTIEHYISEAYAKCAQIILGSRVCFGQARQTRDKRASRWFFLELDEIDALSKELDIWKKDLSSPLVIEVYLHQLASSAMRAGQGANDAMASAATAETLLERWTIQYAPPGASGAAGAAGSSAAGGSSGGGGGGRTYLDEASVHKRLIILTRALVSYTRVLPAYKLFRAAKRLPADHLRLHYRLHRTLQTQQAPSAAASLPAAASAASAGPTSPPPARMQHFVFAPVDTPGGQFRLAVQYHPAAAAAALEAHASAPVPMPAPTTIIHDYYAGSGPAGSAGRAAMGGAGGGGGGQPMPSTSAPATAGMARPLRPTMSASVYGHGPGAGATGRSPPGGGVACADASTSLRHAPSAGSVAGPGGAPAGGPAQGHPSGPAPPRSVVRHSWSSKEMKVAFSLPPPLGSPGVGSHPSTPPPESPVHAARPAPSGSAGGAPPPGAAAPAGPSSGSSLYSGQRPPAGPHSLPHHLPYARTSSGGHGALGATPPGGASPRWGQPPRPPASSGGGAAAQTAAAAAAGAAAAPPSLAPAPVGLADGAQGESRGVAADGLSAAHPSALAQSEQEAGARSNACAAVGTAEPAGQTGGAPRQEGAACGSASGPEAADAGREEGGGRLQALQSGTAPLPIPGKSSARTRSVADLQAPAVYGGFEVDPAVAAAAAASRGASSRGAAAPGCPDSAASGPIAAAAADAAAAAAHRMAPGSAPAAPRGMLGLALEALKPAGGSGDGRRSGAAGSAAGGGGGCAQDGADRNAGDRDCARRGVAGVEGPAAAAQLGPPASPSAASVPAVKERPMGHRGPGAPTPPGSHGTAASPGSSPAAAASGPGSNTALAVVRPPPHPACYHHQRHISIPLGVAAPSGSPPFPMGSLPPYGSPQLPFAFTPSAQSMSLASLHQAMVPLGYFGASQGAGPAHGPGGGGPPRAVSGRDISALATIRRPSWCSRSGSFEPASAGGGMAGGPLLPSLSPLHDLLESAFSNGSTPSHAPRGHGGAQPAASAIFSLSPASASGSGPGTTPASPAAATHGSAGGAGGCARTGPPPRALGMQGGPADAGGGGGGARYEGPRDAAAAAIEAAAHSPSAAARAPYHPHPAPAPSHPTTTAHPTHPHADPHVLYGPPAATGPDGPDSGPLGAPPCALCREDSESDLLPFALDSEGLLGWGAGAAGVGGGGAGGRPGQLPAGAIELSLGLAAARERDVAVGAFVRMVAEAAPLAPPPGHPAGRPLGGAEALEELAGLREALQAALALH